MRRLLAIGLALSLVACREATQIRVEVTTDIDCADHGGTAIAIAPLASLPTKPPASTSSECGPGVIHSVGHAVLVPSSDSDSEVSFEVRTGVGINPASCDAPANAGKCIIARRALRYIPHTGLTVKVAMTADCRGITCEPSKTCVRGSCRPATIDDPSRCQGVGCGDEVLGPTDGGVVEAGADGPVTPGNVAELALGKQHSCALMKNGTVQCWGDNSVGQLGVGSDAGAAPSPTPIPGLTNVKHVHAFSEGNTCALMGDGTVRCWGGACCGQLGNGSVVSQYSPQPVTGLGSVDALAVGRTHACALHASGASVSCWGTWAPPQSNDTPVVVANVGGQVRSIGAGDTLTVLGMKDGTVRVFGDNRFGQLGSGSSDAGATFSTPTQIVGVTGVTSIANGNSFVHATLADGGVVVWGESGGYQLGLNQTNATPSPIQSPGLAGLHGVSLGDQFGCALDATDEVVCWGDNTAKALGAGGGPSPSSFTPVKAGVVANVVVAGWAHACAIDKAGAVWCWGSDDAGQVGDGSKVNRSQPFRLAL